MNEFIGVAPSHFVGLPGRLGPNPCAVTQVPQLPGSPCVDVLVNVSNIKVNIMEQRSDATVPEN